MEPELLATLTQFGTAGLIASMWLVERRSASDRERQLASAHERLLEQRTQLDALLTVIADNTKAVTAVEAGIRTLAAMLNDKR